MIKFVYFIRSKKAVINILSEEETCLRDAITCGRMIKQLQKDGKFTTKKSRNPATYEQYHDETNWKGVNFPSTLEDINTLEENNEDLAINVLQTPADDKDLIVKKRNSVKRRYGRLVKKGKLQTLKDEKEEEEEEEDDEEKEEEEGGKKKKIFQPVDNALTVRTSKHNNRPIKINLLLIHKVIHL